MKMLEEMRPRQIDRKLCSHCEYEYQTRGSNKYHVLRRLFEGLVCISAFESGEERKEDEPLEPATCARLRFHTATLAMMALQTMKEPKRQN